MKNICKFPLSNIPSEISIACFVLETAEETMRKKAVLSANRLILIEQGEGTFLFNSTPLSFSVGALIFGFEGETFQLKDGNNVRYLYIDFNGTRARNLLQRFGIFPATRKTKNFNNLIPFCKECLLSSSPENIDITGESVLLYIFSKLSSSNHKQNDILQKIIDLTEENFNDPELSLTVIAEQIGYNAKYLSHFFKTKMDLNYSEYLRSLRFKYAVSLFENGISSIKNVAFLSGFSDPLHFSNAFKKEMGCSPKQFIATLSKD